MAKSPSDDSDDQESGASFVTAIIPVLVSIAPLVVSIVTLYAVVALRDDGRTHGDEVLIAVVPGLTILLTSIFVYRVIWWVAILIIFSYTILLFFLTLQIACGLVPQCL